jgi:hypothetical protein
MVEDRDDSSPPFYTSLNIHDKVLHNCLMDSGASHNLMPKIVMEVLALEVTPGLQQEQSSTPISLCHDFFLNGVIGCE